VVQKGSTKKEIINAVRLLNKTGIQTSGSIIFGLPTETREEYRQTMDFIVELLEVNSHMGFTSGWYLPYPGTGLYQKAIDEGFVPPADMEGWATFDRWRDDYEMEWIKWDYKLPVKYSRLVIHLLCMAYKYNIPIAKQLLRWRVKNINYRFPIDIMILNKFKAMMASSGNKNIKVIWIKKAIFKFAALRKKQNLK
jgi:hypothetical protein